jgi:hypothetical protein
MFGYKYIPQGEVMNRKICSVCKEEKIYEDFIKSIKNKSGFGSICKNCYNERKRNKRNANIEKTRSSNRESYNRNKKSISDRRKEKFSIPQNIEVRKEYMKNYYQNPYNKEKSRISKQKSLLKNKNKNIEHKHEQRREYDKMRRMEPEYRLKDNMRRRLRSFLKLSLIHI